MHASPTRTNQLAGGKSLQSNQRGGGPLGKLEVEVEHDFNPENQSFSPTKVRIEQSSHLQNSGNDIDFDRVNESLPSIPRADQGEFADSNKEDELEIDDAHYAQNIQMKQEELKNQLNLTLIDEEPNQAIINLKNMDARKDQEEKHSSKSLSQSNSISGIKIPHMPVQVQDPFFNGNGGMGALSALNQVNLSNISGGKNESNSKQNKGTDKH